MHPWQCIQRLRQHRLTDMIRVRAAAIGQHDDPQPKLRHAQKFGPIAWPRAAMADGAQAAHLGHLHAARIVADLAVREGKLAFQAAAQPGIGLQLAHPDHQIGDRRDQPALGMPGIAALRMPPTLRRGDIASGQPRPRLHRAFHQRALRRAERAEQPGLQKIPQIHAGQLLHDQAEQQIIGIAIKISTSRGEIQRPLAENSIEKILPADRHRDVAAPGAKDFHFIAQPGTGMHQMVNGQWDAVIRQLREEFAHRIADRQSALSGQ